MEASLRGLSTHYEQTSSRRPSQVSALVLDYRCWDDERKKRSKALPASLSHPGGEVVCPCKDDISSAGNPRNVWREGRLPMLVRVMRLLGSLLVF